MRTPVERLRIGLLVGASLLVVVIAAFFGYARYKVRRALVDLPGRLGATITKEFNGYTYSQSDGKRTVFTIHAAKAIQHTDGKYTLHDVNMVLYGKAGDRADHISGDDFEYDTTAEVVRALGVVHIDLEAPASPDTVNGDARKHLAGAAASELAQRPAGTSSRVIHVKTSGLVYQKKLGIAATDQGIEFAFGGFTGHAVGALYNSDSGHLVLQAAITLSGVDHGRPVAMNAAHGAFDRVADLADFTDAHYSSAGQTAQAQNAHLHMRTGGTVERIEGEGHVVLAEAGRGTATRGTATSDRAAVSLDATNKPTTAVLTGSVRFAEDEPLRQVQGESDSAHLDFDTQGNLDRALLQRHVRTDERQRREERAAWEERTLTADDLDLTFAAASAHQQPLLRDAKATGSARLTTVATVSKPAKPAVCGNQPVVSGRCSVTTTNKLAADVIEAHLIAPHGVAELSTVHGTGHTAVEQSTSGGINQISLGDTLDASFRELTAAGEQAQGAVELATAIQQGSVAITRSLPGKNTGGMSAPREIQHETAHMAAYDADTGTVTLTGNVRMSETGSTLAADRVVMDRDTQNANADGAVKVTYLESGPQQACTQKSGTGGPVHILAARAEFDHDAGRATFYGRPAVGGSASGPGLARLWQAGVGGQGSAQDAQGGSQIEAPVLVFQEEKKQTEKAKDEWRLTARAEKAGVSGQVHAALAYARKAKPSDEPAKGAEKGAFRLTADGGLTPSHQGVARITSSQMVYSDGDRQAVFAGGVRLLDRDGELRAQQATVYLTPASPDENPASKKVKPAMHDASTGMTDVPCPSVANPPSKDADERGTLAGAPGILGGNVERIVATQHVEITQPGRVATGDRLVFTASDQMFLLTGTAAAPPKVIDAQQGSTTGAALSFHSGDDRVVVSGRDGDAAARKVRTETRIKQQ